MVAARSLEGDIAAFDLSENEHERHILARSRAPARIAAETEVEAQKIATRIWKRSTMSACWRSSSSYPRPAGAEGLVVNEVAPRVHNSGHWTLDGAQTSQFEQHIRAIAGWPLGRRHGGAEWKCTT